MQTEGIIQFKCPDDGALLSAKYFPGMEKANVTCPMCHKKRPFSAYKLVENRKDDLPTDYSDAKGGNGGQTQYGGASASSSSGETEYGFSGSKKSDPPTETQVENNQVTAIGCLRIIGQGKTLFLKPGSNVIGRKAQSSKANIQIPTGEDKRLSREHLLIEVKKVPQVGYVHNASLCRQKCNDTFVDSVKMVPGDSIILKHGNTIKLPGLTLRFEILDPENTAM